MRSSILLVLLVCQNAFCKVFERCELVRELSKKKHRIPSKELGTWVCIARHESQYNTSAIGHLNADLSGDHGLFQISDQYWCSPPGVGLACGLNCDQLEDDDITDDVICARRIYRAHKRRTGNGFTAWAVYGPFCNRDVSAYTEGCEDPPAPTAEPKTSTEKPTHSTANPTSRPPSTTTFVPISLFVTRHPPTTPAPEEPTTSTTTSYLKAFNSYITKKPTPSKTNTGKQTVFPPVGRQFHSRAKDTSLITNQRPRNTFSSDGLDQDPKVAWLKIHHDPRFLDEFP